MNYATLEECCTILDHQRIPIKKSERTEGIIPYYGANGLQGYINDYILTMTLCYWRKTVAHLVQQRHLLLIACQENVG